MAAGDVKRESGSSSGGGEEQAKALEMEAPSTLKHTWHLGLALVDLVSACSAQITIALACYQAYSYYKQGYTDMAFASAGVIAFFCCWSVMILGLVSLSVQSNPVGKRKAPAPYDKEPGHFGNMNGLDLVLPTSPGLARLSVPVAALVIFLQGPIICLSWEAFRDAMKEKAKYRCRMGEGRDVTGLAPLEEELIRDPVQDDELDQGCSLPFTKFVCAGQPEKATFHCSLFVKLFIATFLTFPQLVLQIYLMFAKGQFDALSIFSLGNMVFGYSMATTSALQKRVDVGGGFMMWIGGMLVSAGQICNRAFSLAFLCISFGGGGVLYIVVWMVSDTFWCVALGAFRDTPWDPITYGLFDFTVAPGGIVMLAWRSKLDKVLNGRQLWIITVRFLIGWGAFLLALYKPGSKVCAAGEDYSCYQCCNRRLVDTEVLSLAASFTASCMWGLIVMALAALWIGDKSNSDGDSGRGKVHPEP